MKKSSGWLVVILVIAGCSAALAAPEPAVVQGQNQWTLEVEYEHPQQIEVTCGSKSKPTIFWYMIIKVTNNSGQTVDFFPDCELMTDTFQIIPAGVNVPSRVFRQVAARHKRDYPLLELLDKTSNRVLEGANNAKTIAIIWPDFDHEADSVKFFITGLSNETAVVEHPAKKNEDGEPIKIYLRKTLELEYRVKGDPEYRSKNRLSFVNKRWVMR